MLPRLLKPDFTTSRLRATRGHDSAGQLRYTRRIRGQTAHEVGSKVSEQLIAPSSWRGLSDRLSDALPWRRAARPEPDGPWGGQEALAAGGVRLGRYSGRGWLYRHRVIAMAALAVLAFVYGMAFAVYGRFLLLQLLIPLFVMAAVAVWVLPDTGRAPTRLLDRLVIAFLVALLCWPDYLALALPGLPWITAIRLVGVPMVTVLLICLSVSRGFRAELTEILAGFPIIGRLVITFAVIGLLSIGLSRHPSDSVSKYLVSQMSWTAVFFAAVFVFSRPGRVTMFARLIWGIVILQLLTGIWEAKNSRVPWAGHIPSFLKVEDEAVLRILAGGARAATGIYRVQTRFTTSLGLAEFLAFSLPFVLHITVTTRSLWVRLFGVATVPAVFWLVVKTDSRLGAIGFFLTLLIYLLFWGANRWSTNKQSLFGPAVTIAYPVMFVGFILATFYVGRLRAMVWGTGAQAASTETRQAMYRAGVPMILQNPIGHGVGEGASTLGFYNGAGVLTIDTYYLAVGLEYGVVGFLVFYGMFLTAIWRSGTTAFRTTDPEIAYLAPIAIAFVNFVVIKSVFSQQDNHSLIFAMLGMVVALVARQGMLDRKAGVQRLS